MKYLKIEPTNKKCLIEYKYYVHSEFSGYRIVEAVTWRGGEFLVAIAESVTELESLGLDVDDYEGFENYLESIPHPEDGRVDLIDFGVYEYLNSYHEVASEISVYGPDDSVTARIQDELSENGLVALVETEMLQYDSCAYTILDGFESTLCDESGNLL